MSRLTTERSTWQSIYRIGGLATSITVLLGLLEMSISFFPGGSIIPVTVVDWFELFQNYPFMGLRDLGLINILMTTMGMLIFFTFYAIYRQEREQPYITLAVVMAFIGTGVFYATNRAFPMYALSQQYAAATTETQRIVLEAAGQSLLAVGQSHSAGTFLGFFLTEMAGILIAIVMLRGTIFSKASAITGILGWTILFIHEVLTSFGAGVNLFTTLFVIPGGLFLMAWYILIARKFFQLGRQPVSEPASTGSSI